MTNNAPFHTLLHLIIMPKIINMISGPCSGKSVLAAELFVHMKKQGIHVEYLQEYAKKLVWLKDFEMLNNQHLVSYKYYKSIKALSECKDIEYIILDSSLVNGLYYNRNNLNNLSNVEKTELQILKYFNEFDNINFFVKRGKYEYEQAGRIESEQESMSIDIHLEKLLTHHSIPYNIVQIGDEDIIQKILNTLKN
jgi:hypothetical protein